MTEAKDSLFETVVAFFQSDDWPIQLVEGDQALRTAFRGESGQWTCYARVRGAHEQVCFYSVCPINVPEAQRGAVGEYLHRANYGMIIGNFEMDFSDGEVRYKTSLDVEGDRLTVALVRQLVIANVMMMDRYLPGLMAVTYGDVTPAAAIAEIEKH
ncbi:MAG: YbjN domain-containing protein [bacterium]|nr:YbjN domain-containing protein [Myxococcales bacterium]